MNAATRPGRVPAPSSGRLLRPLLALLVLAGAARAQEEKRLVFALVPGAAPEAHNENEVHAVLECPLNHLGMVVRYHYLDSGPPPAGCLDRARAVLTDLGEAKEAPPWLWDFLENEVAPRKLRVLHFGAWGPLAHDRTRFAAWLARFGLQAQDHFRRGALGLDLTLASREACAYEADPRRGAIHLGPLSTRASNRVWVETRRGEDGGTTCHPVVTGDWGAVALDPWTLHRGTGDEDRRWFLDPFGFFREALGLERVPAPHPAVLNGRRMWFLQVDGDGFESLSSVRAGVPCARIMRDEVFAAYALPFTVSVIVAGLTRDYAVREPTDAMKLARAIFAMPNVEPASHGVLHTLEWRERASDAGLVRNERDMSYPTLDNYAYSHVAEVRDSIRFIDERLTERPRRCAIMLWSGASNPEEDAIRAATDAGCLNLNGGVFRWDPWFDSVGYVSPWSRRVGAEIQVYAGAPNENVYDGFFTTMPTAFRHVDTTLERTGAARILKPANIYIHFYSAENPARLRTIQQLIRRWANEEPTAPVFASTYVRAVRDAVRGARIERTADGWRFSEFGGCRSVRIEGEPRGVDFARSRGILGAKRAGHRLWIHLAEPDAQLVLAGEPPRRPHVEEANCLLVDAALGERGVAVTAVAHNPRVVTFAGFPPKSSVVVRIGDGARTMPADEKGRIVVRLGEPGETRIVAGAGG